MRKIDLTQKFERSKGDRVSYLTMYLNSPYVGFADIGELSTGITFARKLKRNGVKKDKTGGVKWYFGSDTTLSRAVSTARKRYGLKVPVNGWEKVKVKVWNTTDASDIIETLV